MQFTDELPGKKKEKKNDSREVAKFSEYQIRPAGPSCSVLASALGWKDLVGLY